jgi:hypothetical protein
MANDASHMFPKFRQEISKLDSLRNEDFWKTFTELAILRYD